MEFNTQAIARFHHWIEAPHPEEYDQVIDGLTLDDLLYCMMSSNLQAARISWLEYGKRRGLVEAAMKRTKVGGTTCIDYAVSPFAYGCYYDVDTQTLQSTQRLED